MNSAFVITNGWLEVVASPDQQTPFSKEESTAISTAKGDNLNHQSAAVDKPIMLQHKPSPHCDKRSADEVSLLVIHNISLPPGEFGSNHISDLFLGCLNPDEHECFAEIYQLRVAAHLLIRRDGEVIQYVPFNRRAWHAGVSAFEGREGCNDFSIGIEMEGTDTLPYTDEQYQQLALVSKAIMAQYSEITLPRITGHCHIAPGRKTDPGESFDWSRYKAVL